MCERMAAFGIGLNLVTYLVSNLHLPVAFSANIVTNYLGTAYMVCLLGGYIADTYIGRFRTILLGAVLQFLVFNFTPHLQEIDLFQLFQCYFVHVIERHKLISQRNSWTTDFQT
jgi:hypothetical protein